MEKFTFIIQHNVTLWSGPKKADSPFVLPFLLILQVSLICQVQDTLFPSYSQMDLCIHMPSCGWSSWFLHLKCLFTCQIPQMYRIQNCY